MTLPRVLPDGVGRPGTGAVTVATVPADDAAAERLRSRQQAELAVRYGEPDAGTFTPEAALANVVVRDDGEPVAFVALRDVSGTPDGRGGAHPARTGEVKRLYVEPAHRGRGHARTAMRALHERAAAAGLDRLVLETGTLQPESVDLYLSLGYVPIESYGHYAGQPLSRCFALDLRASRAAAPEPTGRRTAAPDAAGPPGAGLETAARERGVSTLLLETGIRQPGAIALYRSLGFRAVVHFPPYDRDNHVALCFAKPLT
ncbi:Acetyltransferase (GNAT) family protein [Cellulosimicrobium cellulans]|nr:Acetyltransferase (GNAT) family protein [Cellulosimicrobium cellulans]